MLQSLIFQFSLYYLRFGRLRKTNEKFIFLAVKVRGRLLEWSLARGSKYSTFGSLENYSLRRDGRLREVDVLLYYFVLKSERNINVVRADAVSAPDFAMNLSLLFVELV